MSSFKSYSEKSKARRALVQVYMIPKEDADGYLQQVDGKWGFELHDTAPLCPLKPGAAFGSETKIDTLPTESEVQALSATATDANEAEAELEDDDEVPPSGPSASAFGAFAQSQLGAAADASAAAAAAPSATVQRVAELKIEKDRAEAHGVKERSKGGLCRAVWDALDSLMTHDEASGLANVPTVAQIKALAEEKGWNVNNASIEYYQWRKFHGISGRGKKQI